jgi:enterochelin esterase family protein
LVSPDVHTDGSVTFRFRAPNALEVKLSLEGTEPVAMQKDDQGVWSATTAPLTPDYYGYSFVADGARLIDPSNPLLKPNLLSTENDVHVSALAPLGMERCATRRRPSSLLRI